MRCRPGDRGPRDGLRPRRGARPGADPEPSWATLRDRLALGYLDAAHILAPLALASALGLSGPPSDLIVPLSLSLNGNAITLSDTLWAAMAPESETLADVARAFGRVARDRREAGRPLTLGTVHPFSCHTYQLRLFAEAGDLDPSAVRLVAVPPQHSVETLARGIVDGFCAGAPWNAVAVAAGLGRIAALGCEVAPDAPEKVLAVSPRLGDAIPALVRAVAEAGRWCAEPANRTDLVHRLARRTYLDLDPDLIARTLGGTISPRCVGTAAGGARLPSPRRGGPGTAPRACPLAPGADEGRRADAARRSPSGRRGGVSAGPLRGRRIVAGLKAPRRAVRSGSTVRHVRHRCDGTGRLRRRYRSVMPGCRKLDTASSNPASRGRVDVSAYVRHRMRPPRATNDNRRVNGHSTWRWAVLIGAVPAVGLMVALSTLL